MLAGGAGGGGRGGGVLRSCLCGGTRIRGRTDQKDPDIQSGQEIDHAEK